MPIPASELVLNPDGSVYHLHLLPEQVAQDIIVVGDPERVPQVSRFFDKVVYKVKKREFITHTGTYKGKPISVISSGIGTDNVEILMTELDALANIDLKKRELKEKHTTLNIIRIGTSGSLQAEIPLGSHLASSYGLGLDTLMCFYDLLQKPLEKQVGERLQNQLSLPFQPYCVSGSEKLLEKFAPHILQGVTVTCCGFYAPQGRSIRTALKIPQLITTLNQFRLAENPTFRLTNFEMETAGYYAMGRLLGHEVLSLNAILANRITHEFHQQPEKVVGELIEQTLSLMNK
ncbi:nucleoside phosphorylase [Thermoflexibacter ruber]|uniref:Uridine phosphorylase n=1 Tax=Thermoflexibacter ruber TaxID=1003 RepID=A0A1I2I361_9BACT|nr:nucleoside phosphorylase [Thermoflexibacter ruber]SFF36088.1 uridine phosphorylase [Thermoflexibacter ruber]